MNRITRLKINNTSQDTQKTRDKLITAIYGTFHETTAERTFFSSMHGTFSNIDNILGHLKLENKSYILKTIEIIPSIFF